jgi:hypothetical protein
MGAKAQPTSNAAFRKFVQGLESRTLFEVEEQVRDLQSQPGWTIVTTMLSDAREDLIGALMQGVQEHAVYANRCGYIAGLAEPRVAVETIFAEAERRREKIAKQAAAESQAQQEGES